MSEGQTNRLLKSGLGWRIGWDPTAVYYQGLIGTDDWAVELTGVELDDFCRLLAQLVETMRHIQAELMDEEAIACEVESEYLWLEAEGYPDAYSIRFILHGDRRVEGQWSSDAVPGLIQAAQNLKVF